MLLLFHFDKPGPRNDGGRERNGGQAPFYGGLQKAQKRGGRNSGSSNIR